MNKQKFNAANSAKANNGKQTEKVITATSIDLSTAGDPTATKLEKSEPEQKPATQPVVTPAAVVPPVMFEAEVTALIEKQLADHNSEIEKSIKANMVARRLLAADPEIEEDVFEAKNAELTSANAELKTKLLTTDKIMAENTDVKNAVHALISSKLTGYGPVVDPVKTAYQTVIDAAAKTYRDAIDAARKTREDALKPVFATESGFMQKLLIAAVSGKISGGAPKAAGNGKGREINVFSISKGGVEIYKSTSGKAALLNLLKSEGVADRLVTADAELKCGFISKDGNVDYVGMSNDSLASKLKTRLTEIGGGYTIAKE